MSVFSFFPENSIKIDENNISKNDLPTILEEIQ
jgi:hypothetical protein